MEAKTQKLAAAATVAAAYAVLTMALAPISYGALQFRVSEVLCILPFFLPFTSWGLFLGCVIANLLTGNVFDIVFGSLATLSASICTAFIGMKWGREKILSCAMGCLMPVLWNGVVVGAVITGAYMGLNVLENLGVFAINALQVAGGEAAVLFILGLPLMKLLYNKKFFVELMHKFN